MKMDLTDAMINEAIERHNQASMTVLVAAMVLLGVMVLVTILKTIFRMKKYKQEGSGRKVRFPILVVPLLVMMGLCGVMTFVLQDKLETQQKHEQTGGSWHVEEVQITSLDKHVEEKRTKKKNGKYKTTTTTSYTASLSGFSDTCEISSAQYSQLTEGETVYAVVDYREKVLYLYDMDEYQYQGDRLEE